MFIELIYRQITLGIRADRQSPKRVYKNWWSKYKQGVKPFI